MANGERAGLRVDTGEKRVYLKAVVRLRCLEFPDVL